ncbi:hypothetical protein [Epilithonimonas vandammei]|uniref:hypothetical protein n=1 Tax=Epilithonimonas vandammei TaxID=2487072 RepID=UPI001E432AEE|nr:hypothetical protein [Epilithonimonas vandammei]
MRFLTFIILLLTFTFSKAQTLNPTSSIGDAGTADSFKGGYTFSYVTAGTPWNGSLISFGGFDNSYDTQLSSNYFGTNLSFRTRNGDNNIWNQWTEVASKESNVFTGNQIINGSVGIGTNNPQASLDVAGSVSFSGDMISSGSNGWIFHTPDDGRKSLHIASAIGNGQFDWSREITFNNNGNVAFHGKVEAKEVKVTQSPTADFVFEDNYPLLKLEDVEKHIKEKKHLPEIASAREMKENGVNVGEFQIQLLQKIEELTIYSIEQNKKIQELEKVVEQLLKTKKQ